MHEDPAVEAGEGESSYYVKYFKLESVFSSWIGIFLGVKMSPEKGANMYPNI